MRSDTDHDARPTRGARLARTVRLALVLALGALGAAQAQDLPAPAPETPAAKLEPDPAQVRACHRYRSELASLHDGASVTRALQSEIERLNSYYRSLNCEGGRFLFFDTRPPQCGAVEQRIRALNATYGGAAMEDNAARRRQLQAAVASTCKDMPVSQHAGGGPQVICVRTCDGAFFPMRNLPDGRSGADEMCQALCPGTEAVAYSMPYGDNALKQAATVKGSRAYVSLANAFKFQKAYVPNCSCKPEGRTWAQSLAKAESMLVRHKGDIFVTPMQAEALSRPKVRLTLVGRADKTAAELAADAAGRIGASPGPAGEAKPGEPKPAEGKSAEGKSAEGKPGEGRPPEAGSPVAEGGADRIVRVIAPGVIAIPPRATP